MADNATPSTSVSTLPVKTKFSQFLAGVGDGSLEEDLGKHVTSIVQHLVALGGGKATSTLTIKLKFKFDRGLMDIDPDVDVKEPKIPRARTVMYASADGRLSRNDIRQTDAFEQRDVETAKRDLRDVAPAVGIVR